VSRRNGFAAWALFFFMSFFLSACGNPSRWVPTDPRITPPDTSHTIIVDSWTIGMTVDANTASATATAQHVPYTLSCRER
jgi:hypothetical protein